MTKTIDETLKEFDELFPPTPGGLGFNHEPHENLKSFLRTALTSRDTELEAMVEGMKNNSNTLGDRDKQFHQVGYNAALSDILEILNARK